MLFFTFVFLSSFPCGTISIAPVKISISYTFMAEMFYFVCLRYLYLDFVG